MKELLQMILGFLGELPLYVLIGVPVLLLVVIILIVWLVRRFRLIKTAEKRMVEEEPDEEITKKLLARPNLVEVLIRRKGDGVIGHFGIAEHLIRKVEARNKPDDVKRLLALAPEEGAIVAFFSSLKKKSVGAVFRTWLDEHPDPLILRAMAMTAKGRNFDGAVAKELLGERIEDIREFSGDPEWPVRYFAIRILLVDNDEKSIRLVSEAFSDPHPLLRRTVAEEMTSGDIDEIFGSLMNLVLDDPVPEVRKAARTRIDNSFPDRWKLEPSGMDPLQSVHVLELLKIGSKEDENVAISALDGDVLESRLAAARFLDKAGALKRIFTEADRGDREDWDRRKRLLLKAVSVDVDGFLHGLGNIEKTSVLLLGAHILLEGGDRRMIPKLAEKAFHLEDPSRQADEEDLYRTAISVVCSRGDQKAHDLLRDELRRRKRNCDVLGFALPLLPPSHVTVYRDVLLEFLQDPGFPEDDVFVSLMSNLPPSMFLGTVMDILESDRSRYAHSVRIRALKCLGGWKLDQTLQTILENLPILPMDQARDFAENLAHMNQKALEERGRFIMSSPDAGIRAAFISCLPVVESKAFTKDIRDGLSDADPDVRIACLRNLMDIGELKATGPALALLRDPVERVRLSAACMAGTKGTDKFLEALETLLNDQDESPVVRQAALEGLAASDTKESVDVLVRFLDQSEELLDETTQALARKTNKKSLTQLVEHFKDSEAILRDKIADAFTAMGESGEDALVNLLHENISSLKPFLADILTRTGFVELEMRRLLHRDPKVRREAAGLLAEIATESAYRGMILAARDPDQIVRVNVTKALEWLATDEGAKILKSLENDPDKKVRRYTHWAMERVRAKNLS